MSRVFSSVVEILLLPRRTHSQEHRLLQSHQQRRFSSLLTWHASHYCTSARPFTVHTDIYSIFCMLLEYRYQHFTMLCSVNAHLSWTYIHL